MSLTGKECGKQKNNKILWYNNYYQGKGKP